MPNLALAAGLGDERGHAHVVGDRLHRLRLPEQPPHLGRQVHAHVCVRVLIEHHVHDLGKAQVVPARVGYVDHHYLVPRLLQIEGQMQPDEPGTAR